MENFFNKIVVYLLSIIIFLLPLFFLPITVDFFYINKQYFLIFTLFFLLFLSLLKIFINKKITWQKNPLDKYLIFFLISLVLSILVSSPNKIQAILNPNFGLISILSLTVLYFYLSSSLSIIQLLNYPITLSSFVLSLIAIILFFEPFKNINLVPNLQFLKNPLFTPIGSQFDLAAFLGFSLIIQIFFIIKNQQEKKFTFLLFIIHYSLLIINLLSLLITLNNIFKPQLNNISLFQNLPPLNISWYSAVEILKNPLTLFFGVGLDNFSSIFTKVKDLSYNQSIFWQISSFDYSRSAILQILTESGILGLISFLAIIFKSINLTKKNVKSLCTIIYSLLIIILLPISIISWFLFFLSLSISSKNQENKQKSELNLQDFPFIYYGIFIFGVLIIAIFGYLLNRHYLSEIYFKKSIDALYTNKNLKEIYENQRQAIIFNPYIEKYHINFSQTNLSISENLVEQLKNSSDEAKINQLRQNIAQAAQQAIIYGKDGAIKLNPQKALNWQNLAEIYKNIIGFAEGADVFAISAYQRAIILDPQNPIYRLNLGGIYYILGQYENAINLFNQAISLKPDWPNAYYNLAWAYYQKNEIEKAVNSMDNVIKLLNKDKNKQDFEKANKELEMFKNKLKEEKKKQENDSQLTLPESPKTNLKPKIKI